MRTSLALLTFAAACASSQTPPPEAPPTTLPVVVTPSNPGVVPPPATLSTAAEDFTKECEGHLVAAQALLGKVLRGERTVAGTLEPYNDLIIELSNAGQPAGLVAETHPDAAMRAAAEACEQKVSAYGTDLSLSRELYEAIKAVPVDGLDAEGKQFVDEELRGFRRAGVDRDEATRTKVKAIAEKEVALGQEFDRNIRDDVRKVKVDPADLAGLPDDYIKGHPPGADGKVEISTDNPDRVPFMTYAKNGAARRQLSTEYNNRGWPKNDAVFKALLAARNERAQLLGYAHWGDYITEDKMIKSAKNAQDFVDKIASAAEKRARKDYKMLLARKQKDDPKAKTVDQWEIGYYDELVKREQLSFDAQSVRPYFDFNQVRNGLLTITARLFDLEYRKIEVTTWHPDVDVFDVYQQGEKLGRIYLDLHPRENKYKHAAHFTIKRGVAGKQLPESALVTNFPTGLMDHDDVTTFFHEFGHLMHAILSGRHHWMNIGGTGAPERDFVEAPSQMLEEWAWDLSTLSLFAKHVETKEVIPAALVKKLRAADEYGKGMFARRQMFYAAMALAYHTQNPAEMDLLGVLKTNQKKYDVIAYADGTHMYASFGHLNGYSAMYYTYMWSLVIAKDLLSEFQKKGLLDENTAHRYRDRVLVPGGAKPAAELVKDFLGRAYGFASFKKWLDQG